VRGHRQRIAEVQTKAAKQLGKSGQDADIPGIARRRGLVAVQALEREFDDRITALESEIAKAEAATPALQRAEGLMQAGQYEQAIEALQAVVAESADCG